VKSLQLQEKQVYKVCESLWRRAASLHFEDGPVSPKLIQMHYVKDELIPVEAA
jgi:hypothetical protein